MPPGTPFVPRFVHGPAFDAKLLNAELAQSARPRIGHQPERISQLCYMCQKNVIGEFSERICHDCAKMNHEARTRVSDLSSRVALVTGCRIKIGHQTALRLLRCGCTVVGTTRFPLLARQTFASEPDYGEWKDRLEIHGLDLRSLGALQVFLAQFMARYTRIDYIFNIAAQTIRRPPAVSFSFVIPGWLLVVFELVLHPACQYGACIVPTDERRCHHGHIVQ